MIWNSLFIISIAQGLFLLILFLCRNSKNLPASRFLMTMLLIMVLTNFGYLIIRTELLLYIPKLYAVPFGMVLLFGPLFYFYSRSVTESSFVWRNSYWLHFIPYLIQLLYSLPFYTLDKVYVLRFITTFLSGELSVRGVEKISFGVQDVHLGLYLFFTFRRLKDVKTNPAANYQVPVSLRIRWLNELLFCFSFFLLTLLVLYILVLFKGKYDPVANYTYTLITSAIIYFIAFRAVLKPELISPDFVQKYQAYTQFESAEEERYLERIKHLMSSERIYLDPGLRLLSLADKLGLPSHQVSKLINEKFGKSFNDLINEYRINEFITRVNNPEYKSLSIYGLALEVGFNSKSSFNSAFKKITGNTPSDYRK